MEINQRFRLSNETKHTWTHTHRDRQTVKTQAEKVTYDKTHPVDTESRNDSMQQSKND